MPQSAAIPSVPPSFAAKKSQILSHLHQPEGTYTDNSPKGAVDAEIRDLIDEINQYEGLVTTSSCAGRVAVFVEGPRGSGDGVRKRGEAGLEGENAIMEGWAVGAGRAERARPTVEAAVKGRQTKRAPTSTSTSASPGGKGGGRWLYVSHDPVPMPPSRVRRRGDGATKPAHDHHDPEQDYFSKLFHLTDPSSPSPSPSSPSLTFSEQPPRLIHLSFSPLILHIHCATLRHARPLLAAAVNAGFRESGVQSLRVLDEAEHGVMVAVRTAGLAFETVVGVAAHTPGCPSCDGEEEDDGEDEDEDEGKATDGSGGKGASEGTSGTMQRVVGEEYLAMCVGVVNERFKWNAERRERFRRELKTAMERNGLGPETAGVAGESCQTRPGWESKEERRRRKREEGLERQRVLKDEGAERHMARQGNDLEELDQGLSTIDIH